MTECFLSWIHYTFWIASFFKTLHENTLVYDIILVARNTVVVKWFFCGMDLTLYEGWSISNVKNMIECFHSLIHYTWRIAYFFRTLHENTLACDIILVARQCISNVVSRSFPLFTVCIVSAKMLLQYQQESLANANVKRATAVHVWMPFTYLEMGVRCNRKNRL